MKNMTFGKGIHPADKKEATEHKAIESFLPSKKVFVPMLQHIGSPVDPLVKIGDLVKAGQKIGDTAAFMSAPVHSPVSGKVIGIEVRPFPVSGFVKTVIIENDEKYEEAEYQPIKDYTKLKSEELLTIVRDRGLVGQGGATFPTHIKLNPPKDKVIDTLLINGAECEPYLNGDNRTMIEHSVEVVSGIKIMMHILNVKTAIIGIEANKQEAVKSMIKATEGIEGIKIAVLETKYPQGGEKQLIKAILNRAVPPKKLPSEVGVVVQNLQTVKSLHDAVIVGKPLIERVVTVAGGGVSNPGNYLVKVGTTFGELLEKAGINHNVVKKVVMGGPMMGLAQYTLDVPVIKGTSGILALTENEIKVTKMHNCINCGRCVAGCPMNLTPLMYGKMAERNKWDELEKYNVMDCMECGSCSYECPAKRPLNEAIKIGKAKMRMKK